ncbi:radical SAM protein [Kordiimonas sediminis]|uniref:Radical SAM protein n=2 Tax=Kordiimonas sediminis TaxID=1735581 RepID=A0A919AYK9_9PROT|nr:radical SAM protein [Kordiimonas sediminis]
MSGRFEAEKRGVFNDGWTGPATAEQGAVQLKTQLYQELPKQVLTKNQSPDVPFDRSVNPYRGCEHGCVYCFARPSHTYMGLSAGLDFESKLFFKENAAEVLRADLSRKGYKVAPIAMGTNTDPYQPIEKQLGITRKILEVLLEVRHPVTIVTKSSLILRDLDLLQELARLNLVKVALSVTTLDRKLARTMEPRASSPQRRLDTIRQLAEKNIPVGALVAPVIPALNDHELENILQAIARAGATEAGYILLRLPLEVKDLFSEWLSVNFAERRTRILRRLYAMRGGRANDPRFGHRMKGKGIEADLMRQRFFNSARRVGVNMSEGHDLDCTQFIPPQNPSDRQLRLF